MNILGVLLNDQVLQATPIDVTTSAAAVESLDADADRISEITLEFGSALLMNL